ncbi:hypothetical protein FHR22_001645 [Sphingopyxis panaciterrae]|uniref:hypothetical protein n=1 Tax=Sphingopyxis panaciterrae TaxID=363841 RepID=UPI001423DD8A|nr:hypothetical protein [Sphingopyxis panaciterrae]NIJ36961.1 hypothetical protein [Sphingopyxis panaciterrae]
MDRRRTLGKLTQLDTVQRLQLADARLSLADAMDGLRIAGERTCASVRELQLSETEFDGILSAISFDPDALRRAAHAIMIAEKKVTERREIEDLARQAERDKRTGWHQQRSRLSAIERQRRNVERKLAQIREDRAAIDALALAAERERGS